MKRPVFAIVDNPVVILVEEWIGGDIAFVRDEVSIAIA